MIKQLKSLNYLCMICKYYVAMIAYTPKYPIVLPSDTVLALCHCTLSEASNIRENCPKTRQDEGFGSSDGGKCFSAVFIRRLRSFPDSWAVYTTNRRHFRQETFLAYMRPWSHIWGAGLKWWLPCGEKHEILR